MGGALIGSLATAAAQCQPSAAASFLFTCNPSPLLGAPRRAADKTPVRIFGPSSGITSSSSGGSSPFGGPGIKRPFSEPAGLSPNMPTPKPASEAPA